MGKAKAGSTAGARSVSLNTHLCSVSALQSSLVCAGVCSSLFLCLSSLVSANAFDSFSVFFRPEIISIETR